MSLLRRHRRPGEGGAVIALAYFVIFAAMVGGIAAAERWLWRPYWQRRGFEWSEERGRLERIRRGMEDRR